MARLFRIAIRDLGRNKRRSGLTLLAVAMGLALVITLHGFEMGAMQGSVKNSIRVQTGHVQVRAESYGADKVSLQWDDLLEQPWDLVEQAQELPQVHSLHQIPRQAHVVVFQKYHPPTQLWSARKLHHLLDNLLGRLVIRVGLASPDDLDGPA